MNVQEYVRVFFNCDTIVIPTAEHGSVAANIVVFVYSKDARLLQHNTLFTQDPTPDAWDEGLLVEAFRAPITIDADRTITIPLLERGTCRVVLLANTAEYEQFMGEDSSTK